MRTFQQAIRDFDFTLSAELALAPASTRQSIEGDIRDLSHLVDAFQVTDSPSGIPHMSPLVAAGFCLQQGKDAVLQVSGRDRNRIALESEILGAAAAGVTSLLAVPDAARQGARSEVWSFQMSDEQRGIWDRNPLGRLPFFRNSALPLAYVE